MAHISLYRRFRPQSFDEMVRQEHVVRVLKNQIESNSIGHAYLFTGPRGTGKTTVARIFARAINCEHPKDGSPCGECSTCLALQNSMDITEIDAASNNGVDQMRDLREKVQYPPVNGKYKVFIIDEVHMLTDSAFNALLKTLEEPPAHAVFILATTEPQKLPATILSRCMRLDFKLIPEEDLEKHLMRVLDGIGKKYEREAVAAIARAGAGSDRDMLSIAEMCIAYSDELTYEGVTAVLGAADFHVTCTLVSSLLQADCGNAIGRTEKILSEGKAVGVLVRNILELLNQILVAKTCQTAEQLLSLPKELFAEVKKLADDADPKAILRATEIMAKTESELRYTASPRIVLETAIVRIATPEEDYDIDALLVRMSALEKELQELKERGIRVSAPAEASSAPKKEEVPAAVPQPTEQQEPETVSDDGYMPFSMEEPIFDEAYFSDEPFDLPAAREEREPVRPEKEEREPARPEKEEREPARPEKKETFTPPTAIQTPPPPAEGSGGASKDAMAVFGKFMRTLRKSCRNGVLVTICSDLEADFEGSLFVLYTDLDTVFRSLKRAEHLEILKQVLSQIGIADFDVRLRGKAVKEDGIAQLKKDFKDYPIEVK